jgi:hypothetical protein
MPLIPTKTRTVSPLTLFVFLLSVALFDWGTQAKLSLYQQPTRSHPVSVAKLLPDNQVDKKIGLPRSSDRRTVSLLAFLAALALFQPKFTFSRGRQAGKVVAPSIPSYPYARFIRPPPSTLW